jgi:hypothetical protein
VCRYKLGVTTLIGVIPGTNRTDAKLDLQPILGIVADELDYLDKVGWEVLDVKTNTIFNCRCRLISVISDYRGLQKILNALGSPGKWACFECWLKALKLAARGKTIYPGAFR